jgi:hypothetical protein
MIRRDIEATVHKMLSTQLFGVLATEGPGGPHSSIVSFVSADDLHTLVFATSRETRKFANLLRTGRASLFFDNRTNQKRDLHEVHGIAALGETRELRGADRGTYEELYLAKYPELTEFVATSALIAMRVTRYDVVHRFQNVVVLPLDETIEGRP